MKIIPHSKRAKNRQREHILDVVREGKFAGVEAVLCRCLVGGCQWTGWFTRDEVDWITDDSDGDI